MNDKIPAIQSYKLMLIATVITIAIVTSSQLITQRIGLLLDRQASELLAADLVVVSNTPLSLSYQQKAQQGGLKTATTTSLRTAIFIGDEPTLVDLKAVSEHYPLRGQLEKARDLTDIKQMSAVGPAAGEVWVDSQLEGLLGKSITLGNQHLQTNWLLTFEPDRGGTLFNLAPRVLMNLEDLNGTGLILPGSRVNYKMLFSGSSNDIEQFRDWLKAELKQSESIQDVESARPEMVRALERTRQFFAFSIILTLVIAMVAIAITARYMAGKEAPKVAMLRAFGISQSRLSTFYLKQIGKLWGLATLLGISLGWVSQYPLQWALDGWFGKNLPQDYSLHAYLIAALVGLISLAGFCLPPLLSVTTTPPMQVFRPSSRNASMKRSLLFSGIAILAVFLVLIVLVQSSKLAIVTLGIILLLSFALPVIFLVVIKAILFSSKRQFWMKNYLLSRLRSSGRGAIVVMSGFCLALLSILLIMVVKDELLAAWKTQLPDNIPNYFLINIAKEDVPSVIKMLDDDAISASSPYPLIRTRLSAINGVPIESIKFTDPRADNLINHTFNVSYSDALPDDNSIAEGKWMTNEATDGFSVEQGMAKKLQLKLGDEVTLRIADETISAPVTSIRTVLWENFKPNFYLIANRQLIEDKPQTWLLSALIDEPHKQSLKKLLQQFPAITLLDISVLMSRIRAIIDRATIALEFFFLFALAAAFIVLMAAIQTGKAERQQESSLLRALSAQNAQLYKVHILEFTLMGLLIGVFAALFASLAGWLVSVRFFEIEYHFSPTIWLVSLISATLVLTVAGMLVSRKVYNVSPMRVLRS